MRAVGPREACGLVSVVASVAVGWLLRGTQSRGQSGGKVTRVLDNRQPTQRPATPVHLHTTPPHSFPFPTTDRLAAAGTLLPIPIFAPTARQCSCLMASWQ